MKPLRNNKSFLDSICWFKLFLFNMISELSRILQICFLSGAENKIFQENLWLKFSFKCFVASVSLEVFSCSSHRSSTLRLVPSMYVYSQTHTPRIWHMMDVDSYFLVSIFFDFLRNPFYSNFVWIVVKFVKFFDERFESVSFLGQYRISAKTNSISNRSGDIM